MALSVGFSFGSGSKLNTIQQIIAKEDWVTTRKMKKKHNKFQQPLPFLPWFYWSWNGRRHSRYSCVLLLLWFNHLIHDFHWYWWLVLASPSNIRWLFICSSYYLMRSRRQRNRPNGISFGLVWFSFCLVPCDRYSHTYRQTFCSTQRNINLYRLICDHLSHITLTFATLKTHTRL